MNSIETRNYNPGYLIALLLVLFVPLFYLEPTGSALAGVYLLLLGLLCLPVFKLLHPWWVPLTIGLIILLPGPMDRMLISVQLTPEKDANPYGIFSVIDLIMFVSLVEQLRRKKKLFNLFNPKIDYVSTGLLLITVLSIFSSFLSYLNFPTFHFPMAVRAVFYSVRFLLVYAWMQNLFTDIREIRKLVFAVFIITLGFVFLVLLSTKENYEGGNRLSVATYGVNTFGHLLAFISLCLIPFLRQFQKERAYLLMLLTGGCLLTCVIFLMMSANRMSSGLLLFGVFTYNMFMPAPFRKKVRLILLSGVAFLFVMGVFALVKPDLFARIFGVFDIVSGEHAVENISELQSRFVVWNISLEMILNHPIFGVGPGQWNYLKNTFGTFPEWMSTILDPHNGYLLYASEMGLLCLIIYYSIIIHAIRSGLKAFKVLKKINHSRPSPDVSFYLSCILMLVIVIVCWLLSDLTNASGLNIRVQSLMWSLCSVLFLAPSLVKKLNAEQPETSGVN